MRMDVTRFGIVLGVVALLASTAATDAGGQRRKHYDRRNLLASTATTDAGPLATMSLKAVDINGTPVTGDQLHIVAERGDQITVELRVRDWATELPNGVRSYQAVVQGRIGAVSGANGTILPLGWDAPPLPAVCTTDDDCIGHRLMFLEQLFDLHGVDPMAISLDEGADPTSKVQAPLSVHVAEITCVEESISVHKRGPFLK